MNKRLTKHVLVRNVLNMWRKQKNDGESKSGSERVNERTSFNFNADNGYL